MQFDIRRFDIYRKVPKDLTQPTLTGACISISSVLFILYLFLSELVGYLTVDIQNELTVEDPVKYSEKIPVFLNISTLNTGCNYIGLDIQDDMGRHEVGMKDNTIKVPINGDVGCRMETHFLINKVPGNFHVSTHAARQQPGKGDMTHIIHEVRFGMKLQNKQVKGSFNALENIDKTKSNAMSTHDYILRVVPSTYEDLRGTTTFPYQYTYSYRDFVQQGHGHGHAVMPAIWFRYELSPITVRYTEHRQPFYHFLTTVCAIIGGTFTVAGILDSCIFTAAEIIRKAELGKLS